MFMCACVCVTGRTQYSGEFLTLAKYIQDAAQGGQILATAACFAQVRLHTHTRSPLSQPLTQHKECLLDA